MQIKEIVDGKQGIYFAWPYSAPICVLSHYDEHRQWWEIGGDLNI